MGCKNQSVLVDSDHLLVKARFRVAAKLAKPSTDEASKLRSLDHCVLRPFTPSYDPVVDGHFREMVRYFFHKPTLSHLSTCERGEAAITQAGLTTLPRRRKRSPDWYQSSCHVLDPLRDRRNVAMHAFMIQKRAHRVTPAVELAKRLTVRVLNRACSKAKNSWIQSTMGKVDLSISNSRWTKDGYDTLRSCKSGLTKPKKVNESPMRMANGSLSSSPREYLQVFVSSLSSIFNTRVPCDHSLLDLLAPHSVMFSMDTLPTDTEIHTAVRKLKHSAGGIDGIQASMYKSILRDNDLFFSLIVPLVCEFWTSHRVPAGWDEMLCTLLFKKGDARLAGNYRSIMVMKMSEKIVLIIMGMRLEKLIESLDIESQCGFRPGRGCRDAIFAVRLLLKKRHEHQCESWVDFVDLVKAFDTVDRAFLWKVLLRFGCPPFFVDKLRAIHASVTIVLRKDGVEERFQSHGGVRQGDILGPPLFLLFMAMVSITRALRKKSADICLLTDPEYEITLHGRKGAGTPFVINESLYADDAANFKVSRADLELDVPAEAAHLTACGLQMHSGSATAPSKTECMFFPKQARCYSDFDPVTGDSLCYDGADFSNVSVSTADGTFVSFCTTFCYLGSILSMDLSDLPDVQHRIRKATAAFFMLGDVLFKNRRVSRATKRITYMCLIVMVCLYGCESWSVTAEIERALNKFQTMCLRHMLRISKKKMRVDRISTVNMLKTLGLESILYYLRFMQLNYLGHVSRMPRFRVQRKLITSWMDKPRLSNFPQTYSRSMLKALASVDIPEDEWQRLAADPISWNKYIRQTDSDRVTARATASNCVLNGSLCNWNRVVSLHAKSSINSKGTPVSTRRRNYILGGGSFSPAHVRGKQVFANPTEQVDIRLLDIRNCVDPSIPRPRALLSFQSAPVPPSLLPKPLSTRGSLSIVDTEIIHSQFFLDVGFGPYKTRKVRLSQCGVYYWRHQQECVHPFHRFSWMLVRDDKCLRRNPARFTSSSVGPPFAPPRASVHGPTCVSFGHADYTASDVLPRSLVFPSGPSRFSFGPAVPAPPVPVAPSWQGPMSDHVSRVMDADTQGYESDYMEEFRHTTTRR